MRIILLLCSLWCVVLKAQQKITIAGYVQEEKNGERLLGVSLYSPSFKVETTTNNYGYFSLTIPSDTAGVLFTAVGYEPLYINYNLTNSLNLVIINLQKKPKSSEIATVVGRKNVAIEQRTNMGQINIPIEVIKALPKFFGETDVLKAIQALPGVSGGAEGTSGIIVRGGSPDQNLIILDGAPLYNTQHLFGIFSTFNADAIKNVELYKGGFPARFGGRLSSVIDVVVKDGNMKEYHGDIGIGLLMSRATIQGPIKKNKTSFVIAGRRSYLDILAQPFVKAAAKAEGIDVGFGAFLYDFNAKVNHIISTKDRLFFSFFSTQDFLKFKVKEGDNNSSSENKIRIGYGNVLGTARWNHIYNKKLFSNTIVGYSKYRFVTELNNKEIDPTGNFAIAAKYLSGITDVNGSINFDYRPNALHSIKFGANLINHNFKPGVSSIKVTDINMPIIDTVINPTVQNSVEGSLYFEDDWEINKALKVNLGVHANFFQSKNKFYPSLQPRLSARYLLLNNWALKAGYSQMAQSIHLLTNSTTTLPIDLWVPSTDKIKPMRSSQYALGVAKTIWNNKYELSAEAYYKTMNGVIEYKDGASYLNASSDTWDTKVEQGKGWSQGLELLLQKSVGRTKGWLGYTLSKTDRQFNTINFGKKFAYKYDRRHDFEAVVTHEINKNWEISATWGYSTATALSLPVANYGSTNLNSPYSFSNYSQSIDYFNGRNGFRLLNYHRLDFSVNYTKQKKRYARTWNLSVYNMYNRKNPFFYFVDYDNTTNQGKIKSFTLLPLIPNLSWSIKF